MRTYIIGMFLFTFPLLASARGEAAYLKQGSVYCISRSAIVEHMQATANADSDLVYDILWKRRLCDYTQAAIAVRLLEDPPTAKWLRVKLSAADGPWRKGSKITIPKDLAVYVRRNSVER